MIYFFIILTFYGYVQCCRYSYILIFDLLDSKLDNEIKNNSTLSALDKESLQQDFLFNVRAKRFDYVTTKTQCEEILLVSEEKLNNVFEKPSVLDRIKAIKNDSTEKNTAKNKLK